MPVVSKAQNAAMHAAANGHSTLGIPSGVGKDFVNGTPAGSVKRLPERVGAKKKKPAADGAIFGSLAP
jgi:hypothetical protein